MSEDQLLAGRAVLVADDDRFTCALLKSVLLSLGAGDVACAIGGAEAGALLKPDGGGRFFDLIISDIDMPRVGGLLLLKAIRCGRAGVDRATPVVLLTGRTARTLVAKAAALDVSGFLAKPVTKGGLIQAVERVYGRRQPLKPADAYFAIDVRTSDEHPLEAPAASQASSCSS